MCNVLKITFIKLIPTILKMVLKTPDVERFDSSLIIILWDFFETPLTNLSLELGLSYVDEDYDEADDDNYSAGRWALKYDRFFFDKFLQFFHFQEGYVSLEDISDLLFRSRSGFRIPVYKSFNVTAQYNFVWNSEPAPGREEVDTRYIFSLGYQY